MPYPVDPKDNRYNAYMKAVFEACERHESWRYGQALFNVLNRMYPELANEIRGTELDPFYLETPGSMIDQFTDWVFDRFMEMDKAQ